VKAAIKSAIGIVFLIGVLVWFLNDSEIFHECVNNQKDHVAYHNLKKDNSGLPIILSIYRDCAWEAVHKNHESLTALFTLVLGLSTIALWLATRTLASQSALDTRIIQRAYMSVTPMGIEKFVKGPFYSCDVLFKNVGHLPARNVRWFFDRIFSDDGFLNNFPIVDERFEGKNVVPPGTEMRLGGNAIENASFEAARKRPIENWLYVWGEVRYDDGFGADRYTKFCHRYNMRSARPDSGYWIKPKSARYHIYGNDAD